MARSRRPTLADATPDVGAELAVAGQRWSVTDHSSYDNAEGYHVDEWECEAQGTKSETAYLLRESDSEIRWYFTRPIPIAAVTLSGGKPFADVAATLTAPPDALVYRGLAHGLDETTDGDYEEDPGESIQKTTWDYWDAKQEMNLAVERWADGRIECFHGRRIEPATITIAGEGADGTSPGSKATARPLVAALIAAVFGFILTVVFAQTVEPALTVSLAFGTIVGFLVSLSGSGRIRLGWLAGAVVVGALFVWWPPLTSVPGLAALVILPAALTRWISLEPPGATARPVGAAFYGVATGTLAAGLYNYYAFAPVPRSFGQYLLAVGPAPLAGLVAAAIAWGVMRASGTR